MQAYINSIGLISAQKTYDGSFLENPVIYGSELKHLSCIEPVYKEFINPVQLRRMSKILKMGLGASSICMNNAPNTEIDSIIVGTGLACIADLEKFLLSVLDENEQMLSPIPFINSSHNTVAAQIAMMKKITGYNNTYCHRGASFESALQDALMLLNEGESKNILVGGIDEYSQHYFEIFKMLEAWKCEKDNGVVLSEGAGFFILSGTKNNDTYAKLSGVHTFLNPKNNEEIKNIISAFLSEHSLKISDIDTFVLGRNGNCLTDYIYSDLEENFINKNSEVLYYKHLSGEFMTSTIFALWAAANVLKTGNIPDVLYVRKKQGHIPKKILIYNHYNNINHSIILLEKP
jgi:3-oxoacyl-[acyl-carrier-protein] synthase III